MADHWTDHAAQPVFTTRIDATGERGNINVVLGRACRLLSEIDVPTDRIHDLKRDVHGAASYDQAIAFIERWFPVDRDGE